MKMWVCLLAMCIAMAPFPTNSFLPLRIPSFNLKVSQRPSALSLRASAQDADLNRLQTSLNNAIEGEDYQKAAEIRDKISQVTGRQGKPDGGWVRIGAPEWLADRAERLGYRMPAQVQRNAMCAVKDSSNIIIRSPTGSGKTLAYMIPLLSGISDDLLDEDLSVYLSRSLSSDASKGQQISRLLRDELPKTPMAIIVVPTRELGVQVNLNILACPQRSSCVSIEIARAHNIGRCRWRHTSCSVATETTPPCSQSASRTNTSRIRASTCSITKAPAASRYRPHKRPVVCASARPVWQ